MLLIADGIDDPAVTRVQGAGLAVHIRNEVVRDVPESVPLAGPTTADEQDEDLPGLLLKRALPFSLRHVVLRTHVFEQIHVSSSLIDGASSRSQHTLVTHAIKTTEASKRSRMDGTHIVPRKRDSVHFASSSNTSA